MVFSGQPSTACLSCRQRRLRCDRVPTGCSPCKRKGRECSGYRDPSALRVRDETSRMTRKFEKTPTKRKNLHDIDVLVYAPEQEAGSEDAEHAVEHQTWLLSQLGNSLMGHTSCPPRQNSHETSLAYFLTSYICASPFRRYVPLFCLEYPGLEDACSIAISATALAAYSRRVRSAEYLECARRKYAIALTRVNELLSNPESAILDRTLVSVLVLGLFEAIVFEPGKSPTSWTAHTVGAMQLLRLRGPRQLTSSISRNLFSHASNNIKTSCIQRSIPVPDDLIAFDKQLALLHYPNEPSIKLAPMVNKIASLRARSLDSPDCNLVHEALELEQEIIVAYSRDCPAWMSYKVEPSSHSPAWAYKRVCHRYPSAHLAKLWNTVRLLRMFLAILIREIASGQLDADLARLRLPDGATSLAEYVSELQRYARENMKTITTEVLASIPSFMEMADFGQRFAPSGRSLAWPLSIIENTDMCGEAARDHAYRNLEMLAGDLNMPQALHPSRFSGSSEAWMHLFYLG